MVTQEVQNYLSTRYNRLLEYANYHAGLAGLDQQGGDVLNEVLLNVLEKDPDKLQGLYNRKKGGYRELDYFILRMIKLNCHSATSPYRHKYKVPKKDENADLPSMDDSDQYNEDQQEDEVITDPQDEPYEEFDKTEIICARFELIRSILNELPVSEVEKDIFRHKFFLDESWSEWKGKQKTRHLQSNYKNVKILIVKKIRGLKFSYSGVVANSIKNMENVKNEFKNTLFPAAYRYSSRYQKALSVHTKYSQLLNQITGNHGRTEI